MDFREGIQNILKIKGIGTVIEANKAIFGIATIGLLMGKDEFQKLAYSMIVDDRKRLRNRAMFSLLADKERDIISTAFDLIPTSIDRKTLIEIIDIVLRFDLEHIVLELNLFDYVGAGLKEYQESYPMSSIEWINQLVADIFKLHGGKTLYNNDCATGDFIMGMLNKGLVDRAIGNTYNYQNSKIAEIKQYFSRKDFKVTNEKFFSTTILEGEKVDMVYCSYPLSMKYEKEEALQMVNSWNFNFPFNKKYSASLLWILDALNHIKPNGIVVALVTNGVLYNGIDDEVRKFLVVNNYIDTIITLPNGILPYTNASTSLIVLKKNRGDCCTIKMIDASKTYSEHRRYKFFEQEDIAQIVHLYENDNHTEKTFNVSLDEIMLNDAYLGMNRYCTDDIENAVVLDDVVDKIFRGYQLGAKELDNLTPDEGEETEYRIINISDIQAEGFVSSDLRPIKSDDKKKYDKFLVEDGDIIITAKNTTIKSAIYRSNGDYKAVLSGNLIAIRVNQKKINPYYLKAFIDSKSGDMAIKSIQTGTSIITINANGLKDMKISLLSMEEQEAIGNEYKKNLDLIIELVEKYKTAANYSNQIFEEIRKKLV
ncbi:MAG: N-6 DNA methylase [Alphaproteobacteria bacterium]|nr:N-6 DNA methylase [Alphaproteobacteria bacterium]MBQ3512532.1 N-6 DNA methylase [Lachnospiraceae bacterium]